MDFPSSSNYCCPESPSNLEGSEVTEYSVPCETQTDSLGLGDSFVEQQGHYFDYKFRNRTAELTQNVRRRERQLLIRRQKRDNILSEKRNLQELFESESIEVDNIDYCNNESSDMEVDQCKKKKRKKRKMWQNIGIKFRAMMSEWLIDIPDDLTENWLVKFCPYGHRNFIIAQHGKTKVFSRTGRYICQFGSYLPGGHYAQRNKGFTVLDCIYHPSSKTFYVFDLLAWKSISYLNSDAEFRFFWLRSQFDDCSGYFNETLGNKYKLELVKEVPAEPSLLQEYMYNIEKNILYEGLLFYNKYEQYVLGTTPLVGWLKSFMLREKLNIDIPEAYNDKIPDNYVDMENFLIQRKQKLPSKIDPVGNMDVTYV